MKRIRKIILLGIFGMLLLFSKEMSSLAEGLGQEVVYTALLYSQTESTGDGTKANPYNRFEDAVENVADGGTIYILASNNAFINDQGEDQPFVIDKEVTIQPEPGAEKAVLTSRAAGIVLGADVTIQNIELSVENTYHDQIYANGYKLSLVNVSRSSGSRLVDLVAGGLYTTQGTLLGTASGTEAQIYIEGSACEFGNLYAGSLNGKYVGDAAIYVKDTKGATLGDIYASGAAEAVFDRDNWFDMEEPPAPEADAEAYSVSGAVTVTLEDAVNKKLEGAGADEGTEVVFMTEYPNYTLSLTNIVSLKVAEGKLCPVTLTAKEAGKLNVSVSSGASLDLSSVGDMIVQNFSGGGTLILGRKSVVTITGSVTGITAFETVGGINGQSGLVEEDWEYIEMKPEETGIFTFIPYATQEDLYLEKQETGTWKICKNPDVVVLFYDSLNQEMGDVSANIECVHITDGVPEGAQALPVPGYHFVSWIDEEDNVVSEEIHFIPQKTADGVYVEGYYLAKFAVNTYKVLFYKNAETNDILAQDFVYDSEANLQVNTYQRTGYEFTGWNTEKDGSGTSFEDGQEVKNLTTVNNGEFVLYAQWKSTTPDSPIIPDSPEDSKGDEIEDSKNNTTPDSGNNNSETIPAKGAVIKDVANKAIYKVISSGDVGGKNGIVEYTKPINKNADTVAIPATITVDGITYKVTSIAKNAFKNNKKINKATIGNNIKNIGANAFYGCKNLKTVKFGKNVTNVGDKAFYKCTKLTKITIPSKVSKIGKSAFYGCKKLKTIIIQTKNLKLSKVGSKAFKGISPKATIKVPKSKYKVYKTILKKRGVSSKARFKKLR